MSTCADTGWGEFPWGTAPWGTGAGAAPGGPLPTLPPFDIFCVGPCGEIGNLLTYDDVVTTGSGAHFPIDPGTGDQLILANTGENASIDFNVSVPHDFTLEFTVQWSDLPADFSDLVHRHSYFGAFSPSGGCVGLFFSKVGIAYTGSVHIDGTNHLVLDTPVQQLPNSQTLVSEDTYWTVRIAMSFTTGAVYIYVTPTASIPVTGQQLQYVLPVIPSASAAIVPPSEVLISANGTALAPTNEGLNTICLGTGVLIPAIPPSADAGPDQAVRFCSVVQLDGRSSFDPQGAPLTYQWRLIDAPFPSQYVVEGFDGNTFPESPPTGFTDKFYSATLAAHNVTIGDVLVIQNKPYTVTGAGDNITHGFFATVDGFVLPDNLSSPTPFKYLIQNGLNTPTSAQPTFYPDVQGIWKFDLVVFDGALASLPAEVVINVTETIVARGCVPDLSFIWNYLSDFWQQVEDRDRIQIFWQGLAQVAAAELLNLWQVDYSKSLRDIQRTFQRRWLHYDLLMQEDPTLLELSSVRAVFAGLESLDFPAAGRTDVSGTHLDLELPLGMGAVTVHFTLPNPVTAAQVQALVQQAAAQVDPRIAVQLIESTDTTRFRVRIDAPYTLSVVSTSTAPFFTTPQTNGMPAGTTGTAIGTQTYRTDRSLQFLDIRLNDFLCIAGVAYRIARVVDDPSDPFPFQRLTLLDPLPTPAGTTWAIAGSATSNDLDFWAGLCEQDDIVTFEVVQTASHRTQTITAPVVAACQATPHVLPVDASAVGAYLATSAVYSVFLFTVLRRKYIPIDPLVVDVPYLQEFIVAADDTAVLRRNVDYFIDTFREQPCLRFITPVPVILGGPDVWQGDLPPAMLWAETSYLDNRPRIEGNFGIPAGFTLDDLSQLPKNVDYLSAVQGLWYAYFSGPTVFNLRAGVQILLGLPFAEVAGTIVEIRTDFSSSTGRILVQDADDTTITRSYTYPVVLALDTNPATGKPYVVGDSVAQFAPLVVGVEVKDYVTTPDWFRGYLEQGAFFEVEKYFKFLVRVSASAFNLPAFLFGQSFVLRIKPTYTYPLFVTLLELGKNGDTTVTVSDQLNFSGTLHLFTGACFNGTDEATMFDQPRPAGGGWRSAFDTSSTTVPSYPTPTLPIRWGYDKNFLCPEDNIIATLCTTFVGPTIPPMDSVFQFDTPVYTADQNEWAAGLTLLIPASTGLNVEGDRTVATNGTLNNISLNITSPTPGTPNTFNLVLQKNHVDAVTVPFTLTGGGIGLNQTISLAVLSGDILTVFIRSSGGGAVTVEWDEILVETGVAVSWAFDTTLPAGTYCSYRLL